MTLGELLNYAELQIPSVMCGLLCLPPVCCIKAVIYVTHSRECLVHSKCSMNAIYYLK